MNSKEIQLTIEAYEAWLARNANYVEFLRAYFEKHLSPSEFARTAECAFAPAKINFPQLGRIPDTVLFDRLSRLSEGWEKVWTASDEYTSPLIRNLGIINKCGGRYGPWIVLALNLVDSFLWPGRRQWRYQRFQEQRSRQRNLLNAFRRDYLQEV